MLETTVQLPGAAAYDTYMEMNTLKINTSISFAW